MSCEAVGAPFKGFRVGGFRNAGGALALWAEFMAGKEGGGILSVSSSLSSSSPVLSVNEGTDERSPFVTGCAFGVVSSAASSVIGEDNSCISTCSVSLRTKLFSTVVFSICSSL